MVSSSYFDQLIYHGGAKKSLALLMSIFLEPNFFFLIFPCQHVNIVPCAKKWYIVLRPNMVENRMWHSQKCVTRPANIMYVAADEK